MFPASLVVVICVYVCLCLDVRCVCSACCNARRVSNHFLRDSTSCWLNIFVDSIYWPRPPPRHFPPACVYSQNTCIVWPAEAGYTPRETAADSAFPVDVIGELVSAWYLSLDAAARADFLSDAEAMGSIMGEVRRCYLALRSPANCNE